MYDSAYCRSNPADVGTRDSEGLSLDKSDASGGDLDNCVDGDAGGNNQPSRRRDQGPRTRHNRHAHPSAKYRPYDGAVARVSCDRETLQATHDIEHFLDYVHSTKSSVSGEVKQCM